MKKLLYLVVCTVLFGSCSDKKEDSITVIETDEIRGDIFRKQHVKTHVGHVDIIKFQEPFIYETLDKVCSFIDEGVEEEYIMAQWRISRDFALELHYKNRVYIDDCINLESTLNSITEMRTSNLRLYTPFSLNEVEFRVAVEMGFDDDAKSTIAAIKAEIEEHIKKLTIAADDYVKAIRSSH